MIDWPHALVNLFKNFESFIIGCTILINGLICFVEFDQPRHIAERNLSQSNCSYPGCTSRIGLDRVLHLADLHVHYIGEDLTPDIRLGTASNQVEA